MFPDMERAIRFYQDVFGFRLSSRDVVSRFDVDGILFELVPASTPEHLTGSGNARLALKVDDLESSITDLRKKGISITPIADKGTGLLAFLHDPDGNEICLWQYLSRPEAGT
jgi:catechol 2,3-dioxygenase-like lactoylglutathione lyase family enzyme